MALTKPIKIVLISSGQPSLNPRLVKEADALSKVGYQVTVLYVYWNDWATQFDIELLKDKNWTAKRIGGSPQNNSLIYNLSRLINKISRRIKSTRLTLYSISRTAWLLKRAAAKHPAHLYIAHNLAALPAAVTAAKKNSALCGFDAEDFHRNETSDDLLDDDVIRKTIIENRYLPMVDQFTASSELIADAYLHLFPRLKPVVIHNVFPNANISLKNISDTLPLKLFWFSQTIGPNRGLEDVVAALKSLSVNDLELHLLGDRPQFVNQFIDTLVGANVKIIFHEPVEPDALMPFAAQFDIGLALEQKHPLNRDLCLTNKIFTYMQAGLAIIASETAAQRKFMNSHTGIGFTYKGGESEALANILNTYQTDRSLLYAHKKNALNLARRQYNWETESLKFLKLVDETLSA